MIRWFVAMNGKQRYTGLFLLMCAVFVFTGCEGYRTPTGGYEVNVSIRIDPPRYAEPTPTQETTFPTSEPSRLGRVTTNRLNVRSAPGVNSPLVGELFLGNVVFISAENDAGTWYQVEDENGVLLGWVSAQYIEEYRG